MQAFNFGIRNSATPSVDETASRYVPSSIYSGPGPAEESLLPTQTLHQQPQYYTNRSTQRIQSQNATFSQYEPRFDQRPVQQRASTIPDVNDPIAMHLLMETAIHDSKDFEIVSFEELEQLKRERSYLRSKVEGAKRQLGLEKKMFEAAQLMSRLSPNTNGEKRSSMSGRKSVGNVNSNEMDKSRQNVEQLSQQVKVLESRLQETDRRIMNHTAGVLQFTHRGLKKNLRKNELPRSPESMASQPRTASGVDTGSEFDERSLYQVPDYVHDFNRSSGMLSRDLQPMEDVASRLQQLNTQLHGMMSNSKSQIDPLPAPPATKNGKAATQLQAHLDYMAQGLDALNKSRSDESAEQVEQLTTRLKSMLQRTDSIGKSPAVIQDVQGDGLHSQLAYSATVLEALNKRVDTLLEQKDILTRQIQQQRELNSKSDAQRDAQIRHLTEELEETKRLQALSDDEAQQKHEQLEAVMQQLDHTKQQQQVAEQQRSAGDRKVLESLQAEHSKLQLELQQKSEHSDTLKRDMGEMETSVAQLQTELTMAKAELDASYGSRAQRAENASLAELTAQNERLKNELDMLSQAHETKGVGSAELQNKVNALQKELKDTIEDYEIMTKASIDFERERDRLEATIDELKGKCEGLEVQLSEDQVKWLGVKTTLPPDTTTTTMLKNEFKRMMRDTRLENIKALKSEQDERRRLEGVIRGLRKESTQGTPSKTKMSTSTSVASP